MVISNSKLKKVNRFFTNLNKFNTEGHELLQLVTGMWNHHFRNVVPPVRPMRSQMSCLQQQSSCNSAFSLLSISPEHQREKSQQDCVKAQGCKEASAGSLPTWEYMGVLLSSPWLNPEGTEVYHHRILKAARVLHNQDNCWLLSQHTQ